MRKAQPSLIMLACLPGPRFSLVAKELADQGFRVLRAETLEDAAAILPAFPELRAMVLDISAEAPVRLLAIQKLLGASEIGLVLAGSAFAADQLEVLGDFPALFHHWESGSHVLARSLRTVCGPRTSPARIHESVDSSALVSEMHQGVAVFLALNTPEPAVHDYRLLACNASFERIMGIRKAEFLGKAMRELEPDQEPRWLAQIDAVVHRGEIRHFEETDPRNGRQLELTAYRPQPGQFAVVVSDISNRKDVERRLLQERRLFESLVETSPAGILMVDTRGMITFANPQCEAILGMPLAQVTARRCNDPAWHLCHPNGLPVEEAELSLEVLASVREPIYNLRYSVVRPDGKHILLSINAAPLLAEGGGFAGLVATLNDITEHTHTENVLRISEDRFRNLADNGMALIWAAGAERYCSFFNKPWLEFTRRPLHLELGIGWLEDVHPDDRNHCLDTYRNAWNERLRFSMDYRLRRWDGVYRWIQDDGVPCYNSEGDFTGYIGHCLDITDHKLAISRINILLSEKDLLLKEVHHRIKNNMASIMGLLSLQASKLKNPLVTAALESASSRIRSMAILYDKLYRTPEFRQISLREYLPSLVGEIRQTYPRTPVIGFDLQIDQVVANVNTVIPLGIIINELINNAMKYAFHQVESGSIRLAIKKDRQHIHLELSDSGPGLPEGFDLSQSKGFGLQLCYQLSRELGGELKLAPPSGAGFRLSIPLDRLN